MRPSRRNAPAATSPNKLIIWLPVGFVLLAALAAYTAVASNAITNAALGFEEVGYLIKAWWYITGAVMPFSATDAAPTLPLFPFSLGALQTQIGLTAPAARIAMVLIGLLNAVLLYSLCRKLTANSLASAAAVLIFIGSPATAYSFTVVSPIALTSLLVISALWLLVFSVGRPKVWRSVAMGLILTAIMMLNIDMALPALFLLIVFMAAVGSARWVHGAIAIAVIAMIIGVCVSALPDQFSVFLLHHPTIAPLLDLAGLAQMTPAVTNFNMSRIAEDAFEGVLLPYNGTLLLCALIIPLTLRGPRVFWVVPIYLFAALAAIVVFRVPGCEACVATAPSQVSAVGALGAAMTLAFLSRLVRQKNLASTPVMIGGVFFALALNTFAPTLAMRDDLISFPAEMLKQPRPGAEQEDIATLMRFIGQSVPPGSEPILLMHQLPALPYAVHMAGRRFATLSIQPLASLANVSVSLTEARRESASAAIERSGGWTAETLRRWVERDYELILWQEGAVAIEPATATLLEANFEAAATTQYRGSTLTLYKRKS